MFSFRSFGLTVGALLLSTAAFAGTAACPDLSGTYNCTAAAAVVRIVQTGCESLEVTVENGRDVKALTLITDGVSREITLPSGADGYLESAYSFSEESLMTQTMAVGSAAGRVDGEVLYTTTFTRLDENGDLISSSTRTGAFGEPQGESATRCKRAL